MRYLILFLLFSCAIPVTTRAQQVDSIYFNLYTDSLKKGLVHFNYINVDGKLSNGTYRPLDSTYIRFECSAGKMKGNVLQLDDTDTATCVTITATLIANPAVKKDIVIFVKKINEIPVLRSEKELIEGWQQKRTKN